MKSKMRIKLSVQRPTSEVVTAALLTLAAAALTYLLLAEFAHYAAIVFCGVLLAIGLTSVAGIMSIGGRLFHTASIALTLALLLAAQVGVALWVGPQLVEQFRALGEQMPRGVATTVAWLESSDFGSFLLSQLPPWEDFVPSARGMIANTGRAVSIGFSKLTDALLVLALGVFLSANPDRYVTGCLRLLPQNHRDRWHKFMDATAHALRRWLLVRFSLMVLIAVLMGIGLLLLGVPLALPLAVLAGLFAFVPYIGPILALIPALAMAMLVEPMQAVYVAALYSGVQLVESYVVSPLVEAKAISLPPALIVVAQVVSAVWLGPVGVLIATPLLVVLVTAVQVLYLEAVLGEEAT